MPITQSFSGTTIPLARFQSVTYRYLGGRSGQPEPACLPRGPILVRYFDAAGNNCVDVMEAIQQDADPAPGAIPASIPRDVSPDRGSMLIPIPLGRPCGGC